MKYKKKGADGVEVEVDLLDEVKGVVEAGVKPISESIKGLKEGQEKSATAVAEIDTRLKAMENLPAVKGGSGAPAAGTAKMYRGYNVQKQLGLIREIAAKDKRFETFGDDQAADEFAKWMIDIVKSSVHKDPDAMQAVHKRQQEMIAKSNYAEGAGATGGYLVPVEYVWDMVQLARSRTFSLQECTVLTMGSNSLKVPAELTLAAVEWDVEAGTISQGEGTFAQVSLDTQRLNGLAVVSNEMLQDSALDIAGILAEQFGYAAALELDNQVLNGTGSPVSGLLTAACGNSVVLGSLSTSFSAQVADNYSDAIYRLNEADAARASFKINRISGHYTRTLKDTNGRPIYADPGALVPKTVYGYPMSVSEVISNTSAVSKAFGVFGDFKKFYIGRRLGFGALDVNPYTNFNTYQTQFRFVSRWALAIARASAFCRIMTAAS